MKKYSIFVFTKYNNLFDFCTIGLEKSFPDTSALLCALLQSPTACFTKERKGYDSIRQSRAEHVTQREA